MTKKGSIKETGEEIPQEEWERFEAATAADPKSASIGTAAADGFRVVREGAAFRGKQGHIYRPAISAEAVGSRALHMQLLEIPPGERAHAHKHERHETAIHILKGVSGCFWGERLEHYAIAGAGDFIYIAADMPHLPHNRSGSEPVIAVIARTDPNEQESVVLLPKLEAGVDWTKAD